MKEIILMAIKTKTDLKDTIAENKLTKQLMIDIVDSYFNYSDIEYGTYVPSISNLSAIDTITLNEFRYVSVGNHVSVEGSFDASDATPPSISTIGISVPIARDFTSDGQISGNVSGLGSVGGEISADTIQDYAIMSFNGLSTSTYRFCVSFSYMKE